MKYDPQKHHRRSIRLKGYDYSQDGAYFVTICTHNREFSLCDIVDGEATLSEDGKIVNYEWMRSSEIRKEIELDAFIIMPNHIHGIIFIHDNKDKNVGANGRSPLRSLGSFVSGFKSITTKRINELHNTPQKPFWQRNYYEHIIRNDRSLNAIRRYIQNNPLIWQYDMENPDVVRIPPKEIKLVFTQKCGFTNEEMDFIIKHSTMYSIDKENVGIYGVNHSELPHE
jgi:REP element-mobilizing transposase RayT